MTSNPYLAKQDRMIPARPRLHIYNIDALNERMSFASSLRSHTDTYNVKKDNVGEYTNEELTEVLLQAMMVCESSAKLGAFRCNFTPYLSKRIVHPESKEFVERMDADGVKAKWILDSYYILDWSTPEPEPDYSNVPHLQPRQAAAQGTDSDDDVDDKKRE